MSNLTTRLRAAADLCRIENDSDFAELFDEAARALVPATLTDEQLAAIAYKGFDDYWTEDCKGLEAEAWAASAKAVLAAHGITSTPTGDSNAK